MTSNDITLIAPYKVGRNWIFAPSTYLLDSWEPVIEEIYLPEISSKSGELSLKVVEKGVLNPAKVSFKASIKQFLLRDTPVEFIDEQKIILDLRGYSPENIAHATTNHLPHALYVKEYLSQLGFPPPVLIFPESLPKYIEKIFVAVGFELRLTNSKVAGTICKFEVTPRVSFRGVRHLIIKSQLSDTNFSDKIMDIGKDLPKKIFISRRSTRCLSNEAEIEKFLSVRGYHKIYLEDYDILKQLAFVSLAENIVAVHGAALGPLLLRTMYEMAPIKLLELFSPGHMTNVYRMVTHQLGGRWVGVRGKLWPSIIKQAYYCLPKNVRKYSLVEFEVCLLSVEAAMDSIDM